MHKQTTPIIAGSALLLSCFAIAPAADDRPNPWSVCVRATYLVTADKSDAFSALGIDFASGAVSVNDKLIPEIDIDYAFSNTLSAELVLTIPQQQTVSLAGVGRLGTFKHLPPTLLFEYRGNPGRSFRPYLGTGVNFTLIWGDDLAVAGVPLRLESSSVGLAGQVGADWQIDERWAFNVDIKYAAIRSKVFAGATALTEARLDPWLYAIGARYKF